MGGDGPRLSGCSICADRMVIMVGTRKRFVVILAWLQLIASSAFGAVLIFGYLTYHSSLGDGVRSVADAVEAVTSAVAKTAEVVEGRQDLLKQSAQTLVDVREVIKQLSDVVEKEKALVPQHAEGLQSVASMMGKLGRLIRSFGDRAVELSVPSGIQWEGMKPMVIMNKPMEHQGRDAIALAQEIASVSNSMSSIASTIGRDGQRAAGALASASNQALTIMDAVEKTLEKVKPQDLRATIAEMQAISRRLKAVSEQTEIVSKGGIVLAGAGLILAVWCFLNSLGMLMLAAGNRPPETRDQPATS
jgi:ABC-type transporter Mla subunit MlaD